MASSQTRRAAALSVVVALHVLLIGGLILGTMAKFIAKKMEYIVAVDIKPEEKEVVKEPPPPPPDFKPPPVAPPPTSDVPVIRGPPSETALAAPKVQAPPPPPAAEKKPEPPPVIPVQFSSNGKQMLADACSDRYPSASRRLNEEGVVKVLVYVSADGRATDAKVETSSGFPRLDEANVACVKAAGKAFMPSKVGNQAVGAWQIMSYRWKLN